MKSLAILLLLGSVFVLSGCGDDPKSTNMSGKEITSKEAVDELQDKAAATAQDVKQKAEEAAAKVEAEVQEVAEKVEAEVQEVAEKVEEEYEELKEATGEVVDKAMDKVDETKNAISNREPQDPIEDISNAMEKYKK